MKIVYSAGNRPGAIDQAIAFIANINNVCTVRIAAYVRNNESNLNRIDWTLNACDNQYDQNESIEQNIFQDIEKYKPDLIISDCEPIVANIANDLGIQLWYCSPLHLLNGVEWPKKSLKGYSEILNESRRLVRSLPSAEKIFIYSPFGEFELSLRLRPGFEWIRPYSSEKFDPTLESKSLLAILPDRSRIDSLSRIINSIPIDSNIIESDNPEYYKQLQSCTDYFTTGETYYLTSAIVNNKKIYISPNVKNTESILNGILVRMFNIGINIGQIDLMNPKLASEQLEMILEKNITFAFPKLKLQCNKQLHERIDSL